MKTADIRRDYRFEALERSDLADNPVQQFSRWLTDALGNDCIADPTAMALATLQADGSLLQRTVLLKDYAEDGFTFFTNLNSLKAQGIRHHPQVSLLFQWLPLSRQVIISGRAERTSRSLDEQYFASRPRESQLAACASAQSQMINDRESLDTAYRNTAEHYQEQTIPCPEHWGGFRVIPERFEFWQGRPSRLHDRFAYNKYRNIWEISRLSP